LTFVGCIEDRFPEGNKPSLDKREYVCLSLDDTLVQICFVLGEEGLKVGGVDVC